MLTHASVFSADFSRIDTGKTVCFLVSGGLSATGDFFYKSTTMGVCPVWGRRRVSTSEVFSFSVLVQMQGWQDI